MLNTPLLSLLKSQTQWVAFNFICFTAYIWPNYSLLIINYVFTATLKQRVILSYTHIYIYNKVFVNIEKGLLDLI
jgi:hypothetical protein